MKKSKLILQALLIIWIASPAIATETTDSNAHDKTGSSTEADTEANNNSDEKNAEQLAAVLAIDADAEFGAYLGGECSTCHTPDGGDGSIPLIHTKTKEYLVSALLEYKNQQRSNEVMRGVTAALTDEEIAALATYFSAQ